MHNLFQIDMVKGYHQIPVAAEDIPKTKPFALFEYLFTPFWLSNTTHTFQCMMNQGVSKLEGVCLYGRLRSQLSNWANTPRSFRSTCCCFGRQWSRPQLRNMCFCCSNFGNSGPYDLGSWFGPHCQTHRRPQDIKHLQCFLCMVIFYRRLLFQVFFRIRAFAVIYL